MQEDATHAPQPAPARRGTGTLHVLTTAIYAGFAIPVTIIALGEFWPAGIALAVIFAVFWPKLPHLPDSGTAEAILKVGPRLPEGPRPSGNASFDAYRADMLGRLEQEQGRFESFLTRLRDAKDKVEFEEFMADRARAARAATGRDDTRPADRAATPELRQPA